ncbi:hypothetical protein T265_07283 [Opisthorchis viverrini]|uniref:Uncharacterized protein n=1 Tax=Opisthorchis viverrini TaxID=6198 RepID=A0A075AC35_OPIVI|nr:hypothetical protein T265_07283 [Opisthorchis viverrini]KER25249.1 hypothetical protein T265_07283 [Opisthorchis viverrini]
MERLRSAIQCATNVSTFGNLQKTFINILLLTEQGAKRATSYFPIVIVFPSDRVSHRYRATECAAPGRLMFQSLRYLKHRDTCIFVMYYS